MRIKIPNNSDASGLILAVDSVIDIHPLYLAVVFM